MTKPRTKPTLKEIAERALKAAEKQFEHYFNVMKEAEKKGILDKSKQ